ncbi:sugar transferase [Lonepinella sp. BR2271]|uniref:sugar transferase n=1 Tax=Lonepinella sp. BR2271 TaxID=3434550 RepID=UPI003F6DB201
MNKKIELTKRHSKWYERLFFSTTMQSVLISLFTVILPAWLMWGKSAYLNDNRSTTVVALVLVCFAHCITLKILKKYPGDKSFSFIFASLLIWFIVLFIALVLFRLDYSNLLLSVSAVLMFVYSTLAYFLAKRWIVPKFAYIPLGRATELTSISNVSWVCLDEENLTAERRYDAIIADLHSPELTAKWQKIIAQAVLSGVPVYNSRQIQQSLTGRVKITHMYENDLGSLLPSPVYSLIKRLMDIALVLITFPITLPIMLITAIAIRLESEGGAMFIQNRVGRGGKEFRIYKFRSMCKDSEKDGAKFASQGDMRVTRIGKFIRKTRIDELPQFFNVLKGDMSLIGPRPEQKTFVDKFEESIPFYNYRHIVRPGISGWAQVVQGYTAGEDETRVKVEHDFYYIKNFSLWLDILIVFKTLKTMLTGFGAR